MDLVTSYLQTMIKGAASVLVIELIIISVILSRPRGLIIHSVMGGQHNTQLDNILNIFLLLQLISPTRVVSFTGLTQCCSVLDIMLTILG